MKIAIDLNCAAGICGGLFDCITRTPYPAYYAFTAFQRPYALGEQAALTCDTDAVCAVAATDGRTGCILIANPTAEPMPLTLHGNGTVRDCYLTADGRTEEPTSLPSTLPPYSFLSVLLDVE